MKYQMPKIYIIYSHEEIQSNNKNEQTAAHAVTWISEK